MRYISFSSSLDMMCYDVLDKEQIKTDDILFLIH
jgi:hypothetical protein